MQRQLFLNHIAQTSDAPMGLEIVGAHGMYLTDAGGKKYLDLIAGIGVSCLGHTHPKVVAAVQKQAATYMHTLVYGEFVLSPQIELASLLTSLLPAPLDNVYFTNSGTEAIEGAMKLAKRYTGRGEIISAFNSYHGSTQGAMSLNSDTYFTAAYQPLLPNIKHIRFNEADNLSLITKLTACVVVETVQAESGIYKPRNSYLQKLRERCDEVGALLILDEIQAGMGRTGSLFAFESYGVVPDILALAKGFGGGMPIGAFVSSKKMMHVLSENPVLGHITTFGGHPVSCAAALATLRELVSTDLIAQAIEKEQVFRKHLNHAGIKAIRSAGLWMAVELADFDTVRKVIKYCLDKGLITDWFLFNDRCLRIAPPLIITEEEIKWSCGVILAALELSQTAVYDKDSDNCVQT
jgi:acetylornithine/N-succinyldiaminopimelate aminotransferase